MTRDQVNTLPDAGIGDDSSDELLRRWCSSHESYGRAWRGRPINKDATKMCSEMRGPRRRGNEWHEWWQPATPVTKGVYSDERRSGDAAVRSACAEKTTVKLVIIVALESRVEDLRRE